VRGAWTESSLTPTREGAIVHGAHRGRLVGLHETTGREVFRSLALHSALRARTASNLRTLPGTILATLVTSGAVKRRGREAEGVLGRDRFSPASPRAAVGLPRTPARLGTNGDLAGAKALDVLD
jgi:hypothetical protein